MDDPGELAVQRFKEHGAEFRMETADALAAHFEAHDLRSAFAFEPPAVEQLFVHVKVHACLPSERHPYLTLFTSGMSDKPQPVPLDNEDCRFAELMMILPPDWLEWRTTSEVRGASIEQARVPSPATSPRLDAAVSWMLFLSRYPHAARTWVGPGHLFPAEEEVIPSSGFTGIVLLEPKLIPWRVAGPEGRQIALHVLIPLYPEEIDFKRSNGTEALLTRFDAHGIRELVDPRRPNVGKSTGIA